MGDVLKKSKMVSVFTYPDVNTREVGRTRDKRRKPRRESSESRFALYLSLFELFSQKSWSRRLKKPRNALQSSKLTTDLALRSTRIENVHVKKIDFNSCTLSETVKSNYERLHNVKHTYLR